MKTKPILDEQPGPYCVQIELTEGCSIQCKFCGIQGIREKPGNYKFMTMDTAANLINKLEWEARERDWNPRFEFAMHGEPSLNPDREAIIAYLRQNFPKSYILFLTNGSGLSGGNTVKKIIGLFNAGVNVLGVEQYGHAPFHKTIMEKFCASDWHLDERYYPDDKDANPHQRRPASTKMLVYIADIFTETKGTHSRINTHCGVGSPPVPTHHGKRCAKPFRELSVRWDGGVALCCNDWRGTYHCGNVNTCGSLNDLWNGPEFNAARRELYLGYRQNIGCCSGCNETSYRSGLIPDSLGKYRMEEPDQESRALIREIVLGKPLTEPVLRPWEK